MNSKDITTTRNNKNKNLMKEEEIIEEDYIDYDDYYDETTTKSYERLNISQINGNIFLQSSLSNKQSEKTYTHIVYDENNNEVDVSSIKKDDIDKIEKIDIGEENFPSLSSKTKSSSCSCSSPSSSISLSKTSQINFKMAVENKNTSNTSCNETSIKETNTSKNSNITNKNKQLSIYEIKKQSEMMAKKIMETKDEDDSDFYSDESEYSDYDY